MPNDTPPHIEYGPKDDGPIWPRTIIRILCWMLFASVLLAMTSCMLNSVVQNIRAMF